MYVIESKLVIFQEDYTDILEGQPVPPQTVYLPPTQEEHINLESTAQNLYNIEPTTQDIHNMGEAVELKRSSRTKRSAISGDYFVCLVEYAFDIGLNCK